MDNKPLFTEFIVEKTHGPHPDYKTDHQVEHSWK